MSFNLAAMLRESRHAKPDYPLCHINDLTFSYAQVDEISGRVASALLGRGLRRGGTVAVQLPNLPRFLFTYFAMLKAGLVMVPLNPRVRRSRPGGHRRPRGVTLPPGVRQAGGRGLLLSRTGCRGRASRGAREHRRSRDSFRRGRAVTG
jgi:hypothetical protein